MCSAGPSTVWLLLSEALCWDVMVCFILEFTMYSRTAMDPGMDPGTDPKWTGSWNGSVDC